ncbi:MAG TPA: PstS family phosphate ABC transporter substrate-binding protein [Candidatus Binatia bacterium]|nr:PstS family phosphate ABC transporter substrate-binding protein [Candidatus Binatia bacterium]
MQIKSLSSLAATALVVLVAASPAQARDQIRIVGSSTVFPIATAVAEQFGRGGKFKTPIVESTGSGGGLKLFCAGVGPDHPDLTNSSRRIKQSEFDECTKNGVTMTEVRIGFDGIVLANSKKSARQNLTKGQVFKALAAKVPSGGQLIPNPYKKWSDIDPALPDVKIEVLGPPPTSGTRDAFVELAMEGGCAEIPGAAELGLTKEACHAIREDGAFVEAGENDNLIVQKLIANPDALGVFGYSFLDQNRDKLQGSLVGGIEPTFENIADGKYGISRSLYVYVKLPHVGTIPGIKEYVVELTSEKAYGPDGYLVDKGLIPLPDAARKEMTKQASELVKLNGL